MIYEKHTARVADVAKHFGYTEQHVRRMARKGLIPCHRRRKMFLFSLDEVREALDRAQGVCSPKSVKMDGELHGPASAGAGFGHPVRLTEPKQQSQHVEPVIERQPDDEITFDDVSDDELFPEGSAPVDDQSLFEGVDIDGIDSLNDEFDI